MNDNVLKMARVILDNPSATARQLAEALGYSEPKSIYYWLRRDGLRGVRELRRRVLRGELGPGPTAARETPAPGSPGPLPVAVSLTGHGEPLFGPDLWHGPAVGPGAFAIAWHPRGALLALARRWLVVVDPAAPVESGDLVMALDPQGAPALWRAYGPGEGRLLVDLDDPRRQLPAGDDLRLVGRVRQLLAEP